MFECIVIVIAAAQSPANNIISIETMNEHVMQSLNVIIKTPHSQIHYHHRVSAHDRSELTLSPMAKEQHNTEKFIEKQKNTNRELMKSNEEKKCHVLKTEH